jgi:hypothetical protein
MKVSELKRILEHVRDENEVMIAIKLPYSTVGAIPMVAVKTAQNGFDWENGKFILRAEEELSPADRDFAQQMRDMQEQLGWAEYEKRNLRAEIKKLNKKYGIES